MFVVLRGAYKVARNVPEGLCVDPCHALPALADLFPFGKGPRHVVDWKLSGKYPLRTNLITNSISKSNRLQTNSKRREHQQLEYSDQVSHVRVDDKVDQGADNVPKVEKSGGEQRIRERPPFPATMLPDPRTNIDCQEQEALADPS
jgi:hypothetical protein